MVQTGGHAPGRLLVTRPARSRVPGNVTASERFPSNGNNRAMAAAAPLDRTGGGADPLRGGEDCSEASERSRAACSHSNRTRHAGSAAAPAGRLCAWSRASSSTSRLVAPLLAGLDRGTPPPPGCRVLWLPGVFTRTRRACAGPNWRMRGAARSGARGEGNARCWVRNPLWGPEGCWEGPAPAY